MCSGTPGVTFDPDLQEAYDSASRVTSTQGQMMPLASTQQVQMQQQAQVLAAAAQKAPERERQGRDWRERLTTDTIN